MVNHIIDAAHLLTAGDDIIYSMLPAHRYLEEHDIPYTSANFPPSTPKGAVNVAAVLGLTEHQTVKTLIFETDKGEQALIMVGGNRNVISSHLKKVLGSRNIQLASAEVVQKTTGYQIGSIPPFSWQPEGFRSFLDQALTREDTLAVGAGVWGYEIFITPEHLIKASDAQVVNLTEQEKPVNPAG